jgi:ribosomal protein S18 acetylase RimI-like enzyme
VQDVYVLPEQRRRGVASALTLGAERLAGKRGQARICLSYGIANDAARLLYEKLGYRDAGVPAERVEGTIVVRGEPMEVDDTLVYLVKDVDPDASGSS